MRWGTLLLLTCLVLVLVDAKKKGKGKGKGKPKPTKGACTNKGQKPSAKIFKKYTEKTKGCPCWWDLTRTDECACCKKGPNIQQCGFPMHRFCYKKEPKGKPQLGCPGVCNNQYTLSTKGHPCFSDHKNQDCAWCTETGFQCEQNKITGPDSKQGSRCTNGKNRNYCKSQQGDCKHIPACDVMAKCTFKKKLSRYLNYWKCECQKEKGFTGNGIQCKDGNGTMSLPLNTGVDVTLSILAEDYTYPFNSGELSLGEKMEALYQEMGKVAVSVCDGDNCLSTFNQNVTEN